MELVEEEQDFLKKKGEKMSKIVDKLREELRIAEIINRAREKNDEPKKARRIRRRT